jgi:ribosomal protein L7/L12
MAAPTFVSAGSSVQGLGAISVAWGAGHQADDIGLLFLETAAQTPSTPSGWTLIVANTTGTPGDAAATGLAVYWKRATGAAEADASVSDAGDHVRGRIFVFRGCETSGDPYVSASSDVEASALTAVTIPGLLTGVDNVYVVQAVSNATDSTANQTITTDWANASLTGYARLGSGNHSSGNGGGFDVAGGVKTTAGTVSSGTTILATASAQVKIMVALIEPQGGGGGTVTEGGIYVATGIKATAGVVSATTATMDTASVQAKIMLALKPIPTPPANLPPVVTPITPKAAAVDVELSFNISISDPEDDTLTVTLEAGTTDVPDGAVVNENPDGTYDFSWTPTSDQAGEWNIILRVTDGTNTIDNQFTIAVNAEPETTLLDIARGIAERAATDIESAQALVDLLDETQQMNANVIKEVRELVADLQASKDYMDSVIADLEDGEVDN